MPGKKAAPTGNRSPAASSFSARASCSLSMKTPLRRTGSGGLFLSRNSRMPVLPPSGSTTASANNCASRSRPAAMPSVQPVRMASMARAPALPRPAQSSWRKMRCTKPSASASSRSTCAGCCHAVFAALRRSFQVRPSALLSPCRTNSRTAACATLSASSAPDARVSTRPIVSAVSPSMERPPRISSSASSSPSGPRFSASRRGSRWVPP